MSTINPDPVPTIACIGGCGRVVAPEAIATAGWTLLPITGRFRCAECGLVLALASSTPGTDEYAGHVTLSPHSRGALKELREMPPLREGVKP